MRSRGIEMGYQSIGYNIKDYVGFVGLKANITDQADYEKLLYDIDDFSQAVSMDNRVRVVVVTGVQKIRYLPVTLKKESNSNMSITEPIAKIEKPVLCGVDGDVIGLALEMILACDIRLCTGRSAFGFDHIKQGLIPFDGGTQRLSRLIGKGKAMEMILVGDLIDANEAHRIGLINRVIRHQDLDKILSELAVEMATNSPVSLNYAKETVNAGMELTLEQGLRLEADLYMLMHTTEDRSEGIKAFQEKRPPSFKGY